MISEKRPLHQHQRVRAASKPAKRCLAILLAALVFAGAAAAEDLTIHLPPSARVSRNTVQYRCGAQAAKIGLPAGPFAVDYITGAGNSLAVVPIHENPLVFSSVVSASGARYAAQQYVWWEAKGAVTVYADSPNGKLQAECKPAATK